MTGQRYDEGEGRDPVVPVPCHDRHLESENPPLSLHPAAPFSLVTSSPPSPPALTTSVKKGGMASSLPPACHCQGTSLPICPPSACLSLSVSARLSLSGRNVLVGD